MAKKWRNTMRKKNTKKVKTLPFRISSDLMKLDDKELRERLQRMPVNILLREHMVLCEDLGRMIERDPEGYYDNKDWAKPCEIVYMIKEEIMRKYHSVIEQIETVEYFSDIGY
jgi:hypothetical protein